MIVKCANCDEPNEINTDFDYPFRMFMCKACKRTNKVKCLVNGPVVTLFDITAYLEIKNEVSRLKFAIGTPEFILIALEEDFADWEFGIENVGGKEYQDSNNNENLYAFRTKAKNVPNRKPSIYETFLTQPLKENTSYDEELKDLKNWPILFHASVGHGVKLGGCKTYREALKIIYGFYNDK